MNEQLRHELNQHLALEFDASHHYLALSIWFERNDLPGFAAWLKTQSADELTHAQRIIDHLLDRDQEVELPAVSAPQMNWESTQIAVESVLASEQKVTASIEKLYAVADSVKDRPAQILLDWFIEEQQEEENVARALLGRLRLAAESNLGLLLIDQELDKGSVPGAMGEPAA